MTIHTCAQLEQVSVRKVNVGGFQSTSHRRRRELANDGRLYNARRSLSGLHAGDVIVTAFASVSMARYCDNCHYAKLVLLR